MLKMILEKADFDALAADLQGEYAERDGKFVLQVDGAFSAIDRDKLTEALRKEREDHGKAKGALKKFGARTPEQLDELDAQVLELQTQLSAAGGDPAKRKAEIDGLVEQRLAARVKPLERQIEELRTENGTLSTENGTLKTERSRGAVIAAVRSQELIKAVGLNPDVQDDAFELWAQHNFRVGEDGRVVTTEAFGTPGLTPLDAFKDLAREGRKRHWFGETSGGGAAGARGRESFGENPFAQKTFNLTKIGVVVRDNPELAKRMARAAHNDKHDALKYLPASLRG